MRRNPETLSSYPLKERIKRTIKYYYTEAWADWERFHQDNKKLVDVPWNYFLNGILLGIAIYLFMSLKYYHGIWRFIGTIISTSIFMAYSEHYFLWFKGKYKD